MAAMLIHDIRNPKVPSNPKNKLKNPLELFTYGSLHGMYVSLSLSSSCARVCILTKAMHLPYLTTTTGGIWRMAYKIDSIGEPAAFFYIFTTPLGAMILVAFWAVIAALVKTYLLEGKF